MRKFTKLSTYLIGFALSLAVLVSCNDDDEVLLADLNVTVEFNDDFIGQSLESLTVTLTNITDNSVLHFVTDASGLVSFTELAPGNYTISCSKSFTAEEVQTITGYHQEITLNAVESVSLVGGVIASETITLEGKPSGKLLIKEVYYSGPPMDFSIFFKDQFVEIYNNSDEVINADGLYVALLSPTRYGQAGDPISTLDFSENIYAEKIIRVPGSGSDYPINPGESIVIAINAVDYTAAGNDDTVDLSTADFDTYAIDWLNGLGRTGSTFFDVDNVDVTTMDNIFMADYAQWFNLNPSGASIAIFRSDSFSAETEDLILDPESSESNPQYWAPIPISDVIDAVDFLLSSESAPWKRVPASLDAGFNYCGSTYSGKSLRRLVAKETADGRKILQDTNNSTNDFEVTDHATPRGFGE